MKDIFYIFRRDLGRILKNRVAIVVVLGICVIPSLYAWFNIAANMDPYKNTNKIKVAVVNNDKGASYQGKTVDAGGQIVNNLRVNKDLDWKFVNEKNGIDY